MTRRITAWLTCVLALSLVGAASSQITDCWEWSVLVETPESVSVCILPDGSGYTLDDCFLFGGTPVDATITVYARDWYYDPIPGLPEDYIRISPLSGNVVFCPGGDYADGPTDINGMTTFTGPILGGGHTLDQPSLTIWTLWNGCGNLPLSPLDIRINSPDINGNLVIDLLDIALFAEVFFGTYDYKADFYWDGVINLADIGLLARGMGASCP